jgi:NAD+ synthase (glutamine-hydrolysing)
MAFLAIILSSTILEIDMKIAIGQINPTIGAFRENCEKIIDMITRAKNKGAALIVFPELALCGYPPDDLLLSRTFIAEGEKSLNALLPYSKDIAILAGLPRTNPVHGEKTLLNSAALLQNGATAQYFDKRLLPTYDLFDEKRYFEPGKSPFFFHLDGKKIAVTLCEDIWGGSEFILESRYKENPLDEIAHGKPDLLINLSASPYHFDKLTTRAHVVKRAAKITNAPALLVNQVGGMDSVIYDGYSLLFDPHGKLLHLSEGFKETLDIIDPFSSPPHPIKIEINPMRDLHDALVLGLRDYFRKENFTKACLGLSGGIDSALVAVLAKEAIGPENITALLMPSPYSSQGSLDDANALAATLGIKTVTIGIDQPYTTFLHLLAPIFDNKPMDVTEENIQARIRGIILMAFSNKTGAIVLSTGNKSEMAMGYCTLYGDMAGGLAVICDLTKDKVYALSHYINRDQEIIPISTLTKEPSAELRPHQKDSDSLPPYPIIDKVLEGYVEKRMTEEEIASHFSLPLDQVIWIVKKIHASEYKRRQAPPGLRVTEKAFSVGRKFPIVQKFR